MKITIKGNPEEIASFFRGLNSTQFLKCESEVAKTPVDVITVPLSRKLKNPFKNFK